LSSNPPTEHQGFMVGFSLAYSSLGCVWHQPVAGS